jgi:hypothetical protein
VKLKLKAKPPKLIKWLRHIPDGAMKYSLVLALAASIAAPLPALSQQPSVCLETLKAVQEAISSERTESMVLNA